MLKAKKRKTSSTSRKTVSRKSIDVKKNIQKPAAKKDKSKLAWQIALGIAAALLFIFIISKFSASLTGNVPAVDAVESTIKDFSLLDNLGEAVGTQDSKDETDVSLKDEIKNKEFLDAFDAFMVKLNEATGKIITPILPIFSSLFGPTKETFLFPKLFFVLATFFFIWHFSGKIEELGERWEIRLLLSLVLGILFTRWVVNDTLLQTVWIPFSAVGNIVGFVWYALRLFVLLAGVIYFTVFVIKGKQNEIWRILIWIGTIIFLIFRWIDGANVTAMGSGKKYLFVYPVSIAILFIMIIISPVIREKMVKAKRKLIKEEITKIRGKSLLIAGKKIETQTGEKMNPTVKKEAEKQAAEGKSSFDHYQEDADGIAHD